MLARQKDRLESLRAIKTALLLAKTESGSHDLTADQELKILQKLVKQRRESAEIYKSRTGWIFTRRKLRKLRSLRNTCPNK